MVFVRGIDHRVEVIIVCDQRLFHGGGEAVHKSGDLGHDHLGLPIGLVGEVMPPPVQVQVLGPLRIARVQTAGAIALGLDSIALQRLEDFLVVLSGRERIPITGAVFD